MEDKAQPMASTAEVLLDLPEGDEKTPPACVALGLFDGVHRGHVALLRKTAALAEENGLLPTVFTFRDESGIKADVPRLTTPEERLARIGACGIRRIHAADFAALRDLTPEAFTSELLLGRLHARAVVCGENYRFGRGGRGDAPLLARLLAAHGVALTVLPTETCGGRAISSSAIRAAIEAGDARTASEMLGYPFSLTAPVLHGRALGRTIGLPTANQCFPENSVLPANGVYAVYARLGTRTLRGIANVGRHPTVSAHDALNCETHLLDFSGDLYGRSLRVEFLCRLRPEKKFPNIEELRRAVCADIENAERMKLWENGQS